MSAYYNSFKSPVLSTIPEIIIRGLVGSDITVGHFESVEKLEEIKKYLDHYFKDHQINYNVENADFTVEIKNDPETSKNTISISSDDLEEPVSITSLLINSIEFKRIRESYPVIRAFLLEEEKMLNLVVDDKTDIKISSFDDLKKVVEERGKKGVNIQRFKGLGEMMPQQLWETTMDPENRTLLQVNIEDAIICDRLFDTLMGERVEPRKEFIETNAVYASNIDI